MNPLWLAAPGLLAILPLAVAVWRIERAARQEWESDGPLFTPAFTADAGVRRNTEAGASALAPSSSAAGPSSSPRPLDGQPPTPLPIDSKEPTDAPQIPG